MRTIITIEIDAPEGPTNHLTSSLLGLVRGDTGAKIAESGGTVLVTRGTSGQVIAEVGEF